MPVISTNTAANTAVRYLNLNSSQQSDSLAKIASGSRINKASDDAAGLAIGTKIQADVATLEQAQTNASHASSILQTADGGMARITDILQRMKSLATQSNSGSVTDAERTYIDAEYSELLGEIDSIATGTRYNGDSLLNGTTDWTTGIAFMVGTDTSDTITVTIDDVSATTLGVATGVDSQANAQTALGEIDTAIDSISAARASLGAQMSRFEFHSETIATSVENLDAAQSALMDADIAKEQTQLSSDEVKTQAAVAALSQANQMPQNLLNLLQ